MMRQAMTSPKSVNLQQIFAHVFVLYLFFVFVKVHCFR